MNRGMYWRHIAEQSSQFLHHAVYILCTINKAMALAVCDCADNVECIILQPFRKIAHSVLRNEQRLGLIEEFLRGIIYEWLILNQSRHRKSAVHTPPQGRMVIIVGG